ncbi:hypothetical protein ETD86_19785 [Nonomuraea turkmeniaca]|uniref:Uncharacterized protein n=1 Tax=Nonomuraea turkmeniaca TaxID=103838 RepID=A0A5S4FHJ2_9ACTN|nr:hypothetical protein [Nonomuraea turkmeniaca]TMR19412.1 hypothetical protein ETD86_19785 [Nonomuraea turkmeniaca]
MINTKVHSLSWGLLAATTPRILLNGHPYPARWGQNVLVLSPGQYQVEVFVPDFRWRPRYGHAHAPVSLQHGQVLELEYRAPLDEFLSGSLGQGAQSWNGSGMLIAILALPAVAVLLGVLVGVVLAFT